MDTQNPTGTDALHSSVSALGLLMTVLGDRFNFDTIRHEFLSGHAHTEHDALSAVLVRIARAKNYKARAVKTKLSRLGVLPYPLLAEGKDGVWFVLGRAGDGRFVIGHGSGITDMWPMEKIAQEWTGRVIFVARRESQQALAARFGLSWFLPVMARFKNPIAEVLIVSAFIQLLGLATPLFFQVVIDKVLVHRGLNTLQVMMVGLVAITAASVVLSFLRTWSFAHTTSRMDAMLGSKLFRHLISLPIAYFESRPTGQTVARVRELDTIRNFLTSSALTLVIDVLFSFIFLIVMVYYSISLTLIVLLTIPAYGLVTVLVTPALREEVKDKFAKGAVSQSLLVETLTGMETLKAMAVEPQIRDKWENQLAAYIHASLRVVNLATFGSQTIQLINRLMTAAILWFGAYAVINQDMTIGALIAFNMLAGQISQPVLRIAQLWQDFQQFRLSIERLGDIINTPAELNSGTGQALEAMRGDIEFDAVTFRYQSGQRAVLRQLSFTITAGEVIGLVGRSGSGKSSITKLIQRLYVPENGRVMIDGVDLALLNPATLRRQIGVVLQENMLFNRSIRDNIALSNPSLPIEAVIGAAKLAGAHDFIMELALGYDTQLEERGANLSGGQRQRIAIARALITNPRILIFDEATSALDYESETIIKANMRQICVGRTVILVAHRLSTVRHANRIFVMDQGTLQEEGSHEALLAQNGIYAHLVRQAME